MLKPVLTDKEIYPTNEVLFSYLGKVKEVYNSLFDYIHDGYPDFVENWKYYNDVKSWLLNVSRKKKTLFWLSIGDESFRTTFYFGTKYERNVDECKISEELKKQFAESAGKKFRGITITFKSEKDVDNFKELLTVKLLCK